MSVPWTREKRTNLVRQIELQAKIEALEDLLGLAGQIKRASIKAEIGEYEKELKNLEGA